MILLKLTLKNRNFKVINLKIYVCIYLDISLLLADDHEFVVRSSCSCGGRLFVGHLNEGLSRRVALAVEYHVHTLVLNVTRVLAEEFHHVLNLNSYTTLRQIKCYEKLLYKINFYLEKLSRYVFKKWWSVILNINFFLSLSCLPRIFNYSFEFHFIIIIWEPTWASNGNPLNRMHSRGLLPEVLPFVDNSFDRFIT